MSEAVIFTSKSARFGLPLLFAGQSQKEIYVNEAHAIIDTLLHCAIEGVLMAPPSASVDGQSWLIGTSPTGDWAGKAGSLACRQAGGWIYIAPRDGLQAVNRANGQIYRYMSGWQFAGQIGAPTGGSVIDAEARSAINQMIIALQKTGILPAA